MAADPHGSRLRIPSRPLSVSEENTVEVSATAMAEEMGRVRNLPGDDDDDMGSEELEEVFGRDALEGVRVSSAEAPIDLDVGEEDGENDDDDD